MLFLAATVGIETPAIAVALEVEPSVIEERRDLLLVVAGAVEMVVVVVVVMAGSFASLLLLLGPPPDAPLPTQGQLAEVNPCVIFKLRLSMDDVCGCETPSLSGDGGGS